jgi:hydroxymethylpyrimidine/phosphomethylpyrimidine kinase
VTPEIELTITPLMSDLSVDALKLGMCDPKILAALLKEWVAILWFCTWVVLPIIIKPVYEIGAGCEGNQL